MVAICLVNLPNAAAQSGTLELSELPPTPSRIAELLRQTDVRFCYGPQEKPSSMTMPNGRRLGALTVYQMNFDFRTQSSVQRRGNRQQLVTTIRLGRRGLTCDHIVWFRELPDRETFWTNRLVLHELDHVRISTDPGHERLFKKLLSENSQTQQSANEQVEDAFRKVTSMVDIRYQELDRLTAHGMLDLPKGTTLDAFLDRSP